MLIKRRQLPGFTRHSHLPSSHARTTLQEACSRAYTPTDGRVVMPLRPRASSSKLLRVLCLSGCRRCAPCHAAIRAHTFFPTRSSRLLPAPVPEARCLGRVWSNGSQRSWSRSSAIFIPTSLMVPIVRPMGIFCCFDKPVQRRFRFKNLINLFLSCDRVSECICICEIVTRRAKFSCCFFTKLYLVINISVGQKFVLTYLF